jgi:hypothetical protein
MTPDPDDRPVYPEEFIGWRGWTVNRNGLLTSVNSSMVWTPNEEFEAICTVGKTHSRIPWAKCSCGIYATKDLSKLRSNGYHNTGVFGTIKMWGNCVDGGEGYRSQFAYPDVIYVPYMSWRLVEALRAYEVPVKLLNPYTGEPESEE